MSTRFDGDLLYNELVLEIVPGGLAMLSKVLVAATVAFALSVSAGAGYAFPIAAFHAIQSPSSVQPVTFWGEPFPYGYSWGVVRACTRYVTVEGSRGAHMERVWVCSVPYRIVPQRTKAISVRG
jgi:hypothetical protein